MRPILFLVIICGYNIFYNKEESIICRLLLPFAVMIALVREWFIISLPNATIVPLRTELHNLANWIQALAFWSVIGGMYLWSRLVPER